MNRPRGRPVKPLEVSAHERTQLEALVGSRSLPHGLVRRARIVLLSADGVPTAEIAKRCDLSRPTVSVWRTRFQEKGIAGLYDEQRPGRPRTIQDERVAEVIRKVIETKPDSGTHWTTRSIAEATGISKSQVHRYFKLFGLQPHRTTSFKLSNDPFFVDKVCDIVGLYLNPPENAMVLCVDEKSQVQALERTQPLLPMGLGYVEGVTHDYVRHGTTTLFAALDVATGEVISQCKKRHRHQEYLAFLRHIEKNVPKDLDIHLVVDNYTTHKHAKVKAWLSNRPRFHVHYTPTYSSWLNQVERWFGIITQRAIRRGSFRNVRELIKSINAFVDNYNKTARPFMWTATSESILGKLERLCKGISGT
jgi:transposase